MINAKVTKCNVLPNFPITCSQPCCQTKSKIYFNYVDSKISPVTYFGACDFINMITQMDVFLFSEVTSESATTRAAVHLYLRRSILAKYFVAFSLTGRLRSKRSLSASLSLSTNSFCCLAEVSLVSGESTESCSTYLPRALCASIKVYIDYAINSMQNFNVFYSSIYLRRLNAF